MYTFQRPGVAREALATRSLMASTPLLDAASSSWTSKEAPLVISTQESHTPHGSPSTGLSQFSAFARILAKALNCERPVRSEPCGVCDSCVDITRGASFDVHEIGR